ncbi:hypothetical protein AGMMS49587_10060 [Spirochaetia bacterium]|nr:hypothetical protein AGMMS49587_10060 [Spirochaetia bacterium]
MKQEMKNRAVLLICLALAAVPALTVGAQPAPSPIGANGFNDLPDSRPVYTPHSALFKATMGTITADADRFMSVLDFSSVSAEKWFAFAGVDEFAMDGFNLGFGTRFGKERKNYFGFAYSGNLVGDLAKLLTNQSVAGFELVNGTSESGGGTATSAPYLKDADGNRVSEGVYTSNQNLNFLIGRGIFGAKIGFAEFIRGTYHADQDAILESSLKPSFEVGLNVGNSFRFKPALRGAIDIHHYNGITTETVREFDVLATGDYIDYTIMKDDLIDFLEPSGGITLGFDFNSSEHSQAELDLIADIAFRMYATNGAKGEITSTQTITDITTTPAIPPVTTEYTTSAISDLRIPASLGFTYRRDLSSRFTLGFNVKLGGGFDLLSITQEDDSGVEYKTKATRLSVAPDVSAGVSYILLPDHFALHGGVGIELFSLEHTKMEDTVADAITTENAVGVPTLRLAVGMTVNFTKNTALDLLVTARNVAEIDTTKFTMLFTIKK